MGVGVIVGVGATVGVCVGVGVGDTAAVVGVAGIDGDGIGVAVRVGTRVGEVTVAAAATGVTGGSTDDNPKTISTTANDAVTVPTVRIDIDMAFTVTGQDSEC